MKIANKDKTMTNFKKGALSPDKKTVPIRNGKKKIMKIF